MPEDSRSWPPSPLLALGRLPSGLFILTARQGERATGLLVSWVQQAGFDPPMLTVALRRDRFVTDWVAASGRFALSQVAAGDKSLLRHFARGFEPDAPAFDGLDLAPISAGGPILARALTYLDAEVSGQVDSGDHRVVLGRIIGGAVLDGEGHPMVHVRRDGSHY